ncbi:MAG: TIGR00730 family Rossman fold protein [Planctomycetes bacterium]|nr:TIGR00730 family Rossman fold protein [Planctomycetota bacterium]
MSNSEFTYRTAAEETWRIFRIMAELVEGIEVMSQVGPAVSIFGSSRTPPASPYYQQATDLAAKLAQRDFGIITGGGPGIMEAANKGAFEAGGTSIGLNISIPQEQEANEYQNVSLNFHYFFVRKVMFVKYAVAFACFPGGFGTMDEFFESMTLIQTEKIRPLKVVLLGSRFWSPLVGWMRETMLGTHQNISPADLDFFTVTDEVDQAVSIICSHFERDRSIAGQPHTAEELRLAPARRETAEGTVYGVPPRSPAKGRSGGHGNPNV